MTADGFLAIIGSGETSPTMVTVHKRLAGRLPAGIAVRDTEDGPAWSRAT
jgi:hypothetical protein